MAVLARREALRAANRASTLRAARVMALSIASEHNAYRSAPVYVNGRVEAMRGNESDESSVNLEIICQLPAYVSLRSQG